MSPNPVERNFVTRYVLGFAIIAAMMLGGGAGGWALASLGVPGGGGSGRYWAPWSSSSWSASDTSGTTNRSTMTEPSGGARGLGVPRTAQAGERQHR